MGDESLFQASARRLSGEGFAAPLIVTGDPFRFIVTEQLAQAALAPQGILIEPEGRNTAPAVLAAALWLAETDPDALMLVAPSDHVIPDADAFRATVHAAVPRAQAGDLVTFGIVPTRPETGYGYLELAPGADAERGHPRNPSPTLLRSRMPRAPKTCWRPAIYLWNAGIFLFTAKAVIEAYRKDSARNAGRGRQALADANRDLGFTRLDARCAGPRPMNISIDYAIMEKADNLVGHALWRRLV